MTLTKPNSTSFKKGNIPWNKGITKEVDNRMCNNTKYSTIDITNMVRNCPDCGKEIRYHKKYTYVYAIRDNKKCRFCANKGKGNKELYRSFDRDAEYRKKLSKSMSGKTKTVEHRKNLSKSHSGKNLSFETRKKLRLISINKWKERTGQQHPNYNPEGCKVFEQIMKTNNSVIQHAENGGEFHIKELGYWVDGYDKENNIVYEYDEKYHNNQIEKDKQRQKEIENFLGCKTIRIKA